MAMIIDGEKNPAIFEEPRRKERKSFLIGGIGHLWTLGWVIFLHSNYEGVVSFWGLGFTFLGFLSNFVAISGNNWMMPYKLRWDDFKRAQEFNDNFRAGDYRWGQDHPVYGQSFLSSKSVRFHYLADVIPLSKSTCSVGDLLLLFGIALTFMYILLLFVYLYMLG